MMFGLLTARGKIGVIQDYWNGCNKWTQFCHICILRKLSTHIYIYFILQQPVVDVNSISLVLKSVNYRWSISSMVWCCLQSFCQVNSNCWELTASDCFLVNCIHDDIIKWKKFPRYWPFVRGIHWSPVYSPHRSQWCGALMFSLICVWINAWVNNHETDDLRHHRAHYESL